MVEKLQVSFPQYGSHVNKKTELQPMVIFIQAAYDLNNLNTKSDTWTNNVLREQLKASLKGSSKTFLSYKEGDWDPVLSQN